MRLRLAVGEQAVDENVAIWNVRWAHVKGHSGHIWNDVADALAERGCTGEMSGFTNGKAVVLAALRPHLWSQMRQDMYGMCSAQ